MSSQEFEGQAAEYQPIEGDGPIPGTIVSMETIDGPDGEHKRVILHVGEGQLVDTSLDRVRLL